MRRLAGTCLAMVVLSPVMGAKSYAQPCNFTGPYEMQNWSSSGIAEGTATITPNSGPTESASFAYDVSGQFGPISFRTATFSATAAATGTINFDWDYTWVHTGSLPGAHLSVFAESPTGRTTIVLADETGPAGGSATIDVEAGRAFGFIVGGSRAQWSGSMQGTATISHLFNAGDDCNGNAVPDNCDIAAGTSDDLNGNGAPDECETVHNITQGTTDWAIQRAIDTAVGGDVIEVGPRTYVEQIKLLGKAITLRSTDGADVTIIDGGAGGSVITCSNSEGPGTVIEGFTVTNGTGTEVAWDTRGGGMYNLGSSPTVTNCIFRGNSAILGGGMYNDGSSPAVTNSTFNGNTATDPARQGIGGGMYNGALSNPTVTNCVFSGNSANNRGGGMHTVYASYPVLINCTFSGNSAGHWGGAVFSDGSPTLTNCILWGNTAPSGGPQVYGLVTIDYSDIQGGWTGTRNIDSNPLFVRDADDGGNGWGDDPNTAGVDESANDDYGDLHLQDGSPCINAGDNYVLPDYVTTDIDGEARIQQCRVDIGADESPYAGAEMDCNANDIVDVCDIAAGTSQDCNTNDIPDECDIQAGTSRDCNTNGIPDECEGLPRGVIYVDDDATGDANTGATWVDALPDLKDAIARAAAANVAEIHVAGGTYTPTETLPGALQTETFTLINGVAIRGGYRGLAAGCDPNDRDLTAFPTVLSGDLRENDLPAHFPDGVAYRDNTFHVVTASGTDATAVLDGVTIAGGRAIRFEDDDGHGGGMLNVNGSPTLINCTFFGNSASGHGGGMYNGFGGSPTLTGCLFSGNMASIGGGMLNYGSSPVVTGCTFRGNTAKAGGAMSEEWDSTTLVTNSLFHRNSAERPDDSDARGGAVDLGYFTRPVFVNCTFSGNSADRGGAVFQGENAKLYNCILWGNTASVRDPEIYGSPRVNYSAVQGGWPGTGNIGDLPAHAPLFVDADGPDNVFGTADDNFRLSSGSPCINAGNPAFVPTPGETDQDGHVRVRCGRVDMGAYEFGIGDHDCDEDVDLTDFSHWEACMMGPAGAPYASGCEAFDFEYDGDVDLYDVRRFQQRFGGVP